MYRIGTFESRRYRAGHGKRGRKTVISMLKKNYPISEICEITGKTEEEILKIKETM